MAPEIRLSATPRSTESVGASAVRRLRRKGQVPAVLYGHGAANLNLAVDARELATVLREVSSSTLLSLVIGEGDVRRVLVQDIQHHPLTGDPIHLDFHQVRLTEKIKAKVPVLATGVSPAVKDHGGVLVQSINEIEVEALPQDLPEAIPLDLSKLATFDDRITVGDLPVPAGVEMHAKSEDVVAVVTPPRTEEELKELETTVEEKVAEVKTETEEKKAAEEAEKAEAGEEKPTEAAEAKKPSKGEKK